MEYTELQTEIEIRFQSEHLDMLQIGYLNLHLHRIINKVAAAMLEEEDSSSSEYFPVDANNELILVRGITIRFENGSFVAKVKLKIASVFSRDNLKRLGRDLAINVAAGLAVAGGTAVVKPEPTLPPKTPPPIVSVAPDVNRMIKDLASNGGGSLTYRSYEDGKVESEVTVDIPNRQERTEGKE